MDRSVPKVGVAIERAGTIVRAEGAEAETRQVRFVASDESVDRYGDIIRAAGWNLKNYRSNPILLYGHDASDLPIGRVPEIDVEGKALIATAEFTPEGVNPFADSVWRLVQEGFLRTVSVGFMPTAEPNILRDEKTDRMTGFEFVGQELLELSVVPVPANPQALAIARGFGLNAETQRRLFGVDERALARIAAEKRARTITLARLQARHV